MKAALSAQTNSTDRNDARGIAQMMRVGLYRPVHVKTLQSQERRMLLTSRRAATMRVPRHRERVARTLELRAQSWLGQQGAVRGPHPRAGRTAWVAGRDRRTDPGSEDDAACANSRASQDAPREDREPLPGAIQAKLAVGQVNDPLEHEADRVADLVMRCQIPHLRSRPHPNRSIANAPPVRRKKKARCKRNPLRQRSRSRGTANCA